MCFHPPVLMLAPAELMVHSFSFLALSTHLLSPGFSLALAGPWNSWCLAVRCTKSCLSGPPHRPCSSTTSMDGSDLPWRSFLARFLAMSGCDLPHKVFQCHSGKLTLSNSIPTSKPWFSVTWLHPSSIRAFQDSPVREEPVSIVEMWEVKECKHLSTHLSFLSFSPSFPTILPVSKIGRILPSSSSQTFLM